MSKHQNAKLQQVFLLPITAKLRRLQDTTYREVLAFARTITGRSDLQGLTDHPELEQLCDALFLIKSGAMEIEYTDSLTDKVGEGIVLKLNVG